ncbi:MAG: L-glutamate gamma-semialdehyde dehydrogenase [Planctomycetota bacterium]|mgnify:FL=1|nr:MAG: L-glutamate gamma-semialdehyde dehydrogenase [Planctomycetota bacterium]REJ94100.1 MAG: L-glutamate gamma-semialdehyde dehydrogenase [Planctomycetota bacterium]
MFDDFSPQQRAAIEQRTQELGRYLFDHLQVDSPSVLERRWWDDRILAWAMQDESVKVQMFRFVDVLPMLTTTEQLVGHLHEYFNEVRERLPSAVRLGMAVTSPRGVMGRALAIAARRNVGASARRFIAGTNVQEVLTAARQQRKRNHGFTLDVLGEAVTSDAEADRYFREYLQLIEQVAPTVNGWPEVPQIDRAPFGELPRANISVKLSALDSQADPIDPAGAIRRTGERLAELLRAAAAHRTFINVDMESYRTKDLTFAIFKEVLARDEFRQRDDVGIVVQAYLRDAEQDLVALRDWAARRGTPVWVRLVKGAYWDYETVHAQAEGWPVPVFERKWRTDASFERLARFLVGNHETLRPALGSHNLRSIAHAMAAVEQLELPEGTLELQMLYGMGDAEKKVLTEMGMRMRIYMPYGQLIPGMAYLVRRLLENTSNDSFLRASFTEHVATETLLMAPEQVGQQDGAAASDANEAVAATTEDASGTASAAPKFRNEPHADFSVEENRQAMAAALAEVRTRLGQTYSLVIGGEEIATSEVLESVNPSQQTEVVGRVASATTDHAEMAVAAAQQALAEWSGSDVERRAGALRQAAAVMRRRRFELAAWQVFECGKGWREADGDVCEAIDFCEYYATSARLMAGDGVDVPGEENTLEYHARGVTAVIAPWNFPLAILTGMTVAALVTGNTVVMKPAEQSSVNGALLMQIFSEVGLPAGVLNYLPGAGEVVGAALVEHPQVALIAFTGSRGVGLAINERAAACSTAGTNMVKRVIAEMGGKNAIIVDDDADLDEAVLGVLQSAFGYQGQKCSACSRCIVLEAVYEPFLARLVEAARSLHVGPAEEPGSRVGPVIDEEARAKIQEYIELGRREGREVLAVDVGELAEQGYFVGPHIFADVAPEARLAREEVFGPVLAVMRAGDLDEALAIANGTDYALTGGIYSRSPANLKKVRAEMVVGNLYLNRPITGALVARQPFGGFRLSGIGSKAGGSDYLLQFVVPRTVTENTMRRGFAPTAEADEND